MRRQSRAGPGGGRQTRLDRQRVASCVIPSAEFTSLRTGHWLFETKESLFIFVQPNAVTNTRKIAKEWRQLAEGKVVGNK